MVKEYVEFADGAYRIAGTRISLDSVVACFHEGMAPESILDSFPGLNLEQVYGTITYYLGNQPEIDDYLCQGDRLASEQHAESGRRNADLLERMRRVRNESPVRGDHRLQEPADPHDRR